MLGGKRASKSNGMHVCCVLVPNPAGMLAATASSPAALLRHTSSFVSPSYTIAVWCGVVWCSFTFMCLMSAQMGNGRCVWGGAGLEIALSQHRVLLPPPAPASAPAPSTTAGWDDVGADIMARFDEGEALLITVQSVMGRDYPVRCVKDPDS